MSSRPFGAGFCVGFGLLASSSPALAGAWTLPAGQGELVVTDTSSSGDRVFDSAGALRAAPRYNKLELQGVVEYGVTDQLTVMAAPSLQHVDIADPAARRTGLGYTELGGRYRIANGALANGDTWVFSGQTTLRLPGTFDRSNPAAIGYTDPEMDVRGLLGYGFAVGSSPAFIDIEMAQRFRLDSAPNEFRADATFGVRPAAGWLLLAQSFNVVSEGAGTWGLPSYHYHKLQLSAVYDVTKTLSLQVGGFTAYAGRNALQENGLILGAWYKF
jgi:hypothetical protein